MNASELVEQAKDRSVAALIEEVIALGRECAVDITGDPDDAETVGSTKEALVAIRAALEMGKRAHRNLQEVDDLMLGQKAPRAQAGEEV